MIDREKVIVGLERCQLYNKLNCDKCPYDYNGRGNGKSECTAELASDAAALLKEQPEVVRCKDCKYWDSEEHDCNIKIGWFACGADWFCADGIANDTNVINK